MLQWLTDRVASFQINHNAHREFNMSIEQHLHHRRRIGETPILAGPNPDTPRSTDLWELRVVLHDGQQFDVVGSDLATCVRTAEKAVRIRQGLSLAA